MLVLIPARGASKRIPRKNIKILGGKPLLQWTVEVAQQLPVRDVIVSTEDSEIARVAESLGATVLMRPAELASDTATDHDVVRHFLLNYLCERIVYLRPTTPFRDVAMMLKAIDVIEYDPDASSLRSVQEMPESAFKCFTLDEWHIANPIHYNDRDFSNFPNQACPKTYAANGYIDLIFPRAHGFELNNVFGFDIYGYITPPTIELDTPEQWAYAEYLIEKGLV